MINWVLEVDDVPCPVDDMKMIAEYSLSCVELFRGNRLRKGSPTVQGADRWYVWETVYNADSSAEPTRQENACDLTLRHCWAQASHASLHSFNGSTFNVQRFTNLTASYFRSVSDRQVL